MRKIIIEIDLDEIDNADLTFEDGIPSINIESSERRGITELNKNGIVHYIRGSRTILIPFTKFEVIEK